MIETKKYELPMIRTLSGGEAVYGRGIFEMDLTGYTKRQADAMVRDHIAGGSTADEDTDPTESQRVWLAKYGYPTPPSRVRAQALISDIAEQLDWDSICYQELKIGSRVVHVRNKSKVLIVRSLKPGQKCKFEGTSDTCYPRMLRLYRSDGDYTNTGIPKDYFWRNWMEK